jgi:hypothetical protein
MKAVTHFKLHPIEDRKWGSWQSDLCFDGRPLGLRLDGVLLLAQFEVSPGYLLATASDYVLKIYLLSREFRMLDVRMITIWEGSGQQQLNNLLVSEDSITFSYGTAAVWEVVIMKEPHLAFRAAGPYGGRDFGDPRIGYRYLELHKVG